MADSFAACGARVFVSDIDDAALAECGHPGMRADAGRASDLDAFMAEGLRHLVPRQPSAPGNTAAI